MANPMLVALGRFQRAAAEVHPYGRAVLSTAAAALCVAGANRLLSSWAVGNALVGQDSAAASWDWSQEIVLITGGSSGLGRAMAARFARRGVKVVVLDLQPPLVADNGDDGDDGDDGDPFDAKEGVWFYEVDITSDEALAAAAARVRKEVGEPTVLINNAGVGHGQTLLGSTPGQVRRVFAVNAVAPLLVTREFLPAMVRRNHGHVVNMASTASFVTIAGNVDYSCTKASLLALHEGLAQELRHRYHAPRVRTTIVHPNWVQTPLLQGLAEHKSFHEPVMKAADVANAVVEHVLSGRSGQIVLPRRLSFLSSIRAFPTWLQECIRSSRADALRVVSEIQTPGR